MTIMVNVIYRLKVGAILTIPIYGDNLSLINAHNEVN
jgi:hypothetical protein